MKVKNQILVIGGYGQVGSRICTMLSGKYPGKVIAAGKNLAKAEAFSRSQEGKVIPLKLDIREQRDLCLFDSVRLVVMCLDQTDTRFVEACLESGTNYMDISASYELLSTVERLDDHAKASGAAAMLSVGLAPGLTSLMARAAADRMEYCEEVRITVMLGLGEKHGKAAIEWTVDQMNTTFTIGLLGTPRTVQSFTDGIKTNFYSALF